MNVIIIEAAAAADATKVTSQDVSHLMRLRVYKRAITRNRLRAIDWLLSEANLHFRLLLVSNL